jgi:ABC-2 type transport system ATP-binding protein
VVGDWSGRGGVVGAAQDRPRRAERGSIGNAVHVAGLDAALLAQALAPLRANSALLVSPVAPNLEDVFVSLIANAQDNFVVEAKP